ncbi:MAG: hypothetical protein M3Y59_14285 [Myxococcota bacterium]|nr:hypothetical protein [Myxococcota bacterium]
MASPGRRPSRSLIPYLPSVPNRTDGQPPPPAGRRRFQLSPRWRPYVLVLGTVLMSTTATLLGWWFLSARTPAAGQGGKLVPVLLTVDSNLPVVVKVRHRQSERRGLRDEVEVLGETPDIRDVSGAHVGDLILLENAVQGASYEHRIEYGQPNERVVLRKEFSTGHVQFRIGKAASYQLGVYRNATQLAPYVPDVKIELVEGRHQLEIRGHRLRQPVRVTVEVRAGEVSYVTPPRLDLEP